MRKKLFIALLIASLAVFGLTSPAASAGDGYTDLIAENNETSISGSVSMTMGGKKDLSGFIKYGANYEKSGYRWSLTGTIRWASSNPDIVSVDAKGAAEAHRVGTARITATGWDDSGIKHVQTVIVGVTRKSVAVSNSFEIGAGTWLDLSQLGRIHSGSRDIKWKSSVPGIASVDSEGLVLARSIGRCVVTAIHADENGAEQEIKYRIRVTEVVTGGDARNSAITLEAGSRIDVGKLYYPNYQSLPSVLGQVSCRTGNQDVLSVSGLIVSAKSAGSGAIYMEKTEKNYETIHHKLTVTVRN